uniref:LBH domain-containing protein n=1 Tax=Amphiprion ocellaris TaxID=80972 RepID=A0AAQ5Z752_AMPOC
NTDLLILLSCTYFQLDLSAPFSTLFSLQIFPDPVEVVLGPETSLNSLDHDHEKERLPSIVVEPTEVSEVESGELRWPPENMDMDEDEEDLFLEQCIPPANIADWGEEEEEEEETSKQPTHSHPDFSHLDACSHPT